MTKYLITYVAVLVAFAGIDMVWLMGVARSTYVAELGSLLRKQPNLTAAVLFYLLYAAGILLFAVRPTADASSLTLALGLGAALGLVAYGTYDLTNLAIVQGYGLRIAIVDMAWGTFVTALAAGIGAQVLRALA